MRAAFLIILMVLSLPGCSEPVRTYGLNRLDDLTDVAHLDLMGATPGCIVNVGPLMLGYEEAYHPAARFMLGLGGPQLAMPYGTAFGVIWPLERMEGAGRFHFLALEGYEYPVPRYAAKVPPWGSVGVEVGSGRFGVGVRLDAVEFADLVLGVVGIDLTGDDALPPEGAEVRPGFIRP